MERERERRVRVEEFIIETYLIKRVVVSYRIYTCAILEQYYYNITFICFFSTFYYAHCIIFFRNVSP